MPPPKILYRLLFNCLYYLPNATKNSTSALKTDAKMHWRAWTMQSLNYYLQALYEYKSSDRNVRFIDKNLMVQLYCIFIAYCV